MAVDQSKLRATSIFNGLAPGELPKAVYIPLDFTAGTGGTSGADIEIDLELFEQEAHLSMVQGVFIDNTLSGLAFTLTALTSQHSITMPAGKQGYLPIFAPSKTKFNASVGLAIAAGLVKLQMLNVPMAAVVY